MPQPAPATPVAPTPANDHQGFLGRVLGHFTPSPSDTTTPDPAQGAPRTMGLVASALPLAAMAARRIPIGLALLGVAAVGVALANPKTRGKIMAAGRNGLAALRR